MKQELSARQKQIDCLESTMRELTYNDDQIPEKVKCP